MVTETQFSYEHILGDRTQFFTNFGEAKNKIIAIVVILELVFSSSVSIGRISLTEMKY